MCSLSSTRGGKRNSGEEWAEIFLFGDWPLDCLHLCEAIEQKGENASLP